MAGGHAGPPYLLFGRLAKDRMSILFSAYFSMQVSLIQHRFSLSPAAKYPKWKDTHLFEQTVEALEAILSLGKAVLAYII